MARSIAASTRLPRVIGHLLVVCLFSIVGCRSSGGTGEKIPYYVGPGACAKCHPEAYAGFSGSHHDLAMGRATPEAVLGNFNESVFTSHGVTTTFSRRGDAYLVNTEGPDGKLHDYEVVYTFGTEPLQQYLVEFVGGRMQVLSIAWDSRPGDEGGQRWFSLYPDERIEPGDPLHWTRPTQNWNSQCAACHSTNLHKRFDDDSLSYSTTWSEIDVSCEACHGPGSMHVGWAMLPASARGDMDDPYGVALDRKWTRAPGDSVARLASGATPSDQLNTCAPCHSHRTVLVDSLVHGGTFDESYRLSWIQEPLFFIDGHMREEVFVAGSFRQSRMFQVGVQCTDCHDPHTAKLLAQGDALCIGCHSPAVFATPDHSHHANESDVRCVDCHMPSRTYMVIDGRRDHSFSVPRPDMAYRLGVPDVCSSCHESEPPQEIVAAFQEWYPDRATQEHFADVFARARVGDPSALGPLTTIVRNPESATLLRASALTMLRFYPPEVVIDLLLPFAEDEELLLRRATMEVLAGLPLGMSNATLTRGLSDPSRSVRLAAAQSLVDAGAEFATGEYTFFVNRAFEEYRATLRSSADLSAGQLRLAALELALGDFNAAERAFLRALDIDDLFAPASINLADFYRRSGRENASVEVLQSALSRSPTDPVLHYAYGLALVRSGQQARAMAHLETAAFGSPQTPHVVLAYALALHSVDRTLDAIDLLRQGLEHNPYDRELISAIVSYYREVGNLEESDRFSSRLQETAYPSLDGDRQVNLKGAESR